MKKYPIWKWSCLMMLILTAACSLFKQDDARECADDGVIIGQDFRRCACCGGYFIEIEGDTLRSLTLPQSFTERLDLKTFPIPVELDWNEPEMRCLGDEIEVTCIQTID